MVSRSTRKKSASGRSAPLAVIKPESDAAPGSDALFAIMASTRALYAAGSARSHGFGAQTWSVEPSSSPGKRWRLKAPT